MLREEDAVVNRASKPGLPPVWSVLNVWQQVDLVSCTWSSTCTAAGSEKRENRCFHLALHQHGHVHEHAMEFSDAVLQLDDLIVPRLNLIHGLLGDVVHYYLRRSDTRKERVAKTVFIFRILLNWLVFLPPR